MSTEVTKPYLWTVRAALLLTLGSLLQQFQEATLGPGSLLCSPTNHVAPETTEAHNRLLPIGFYHEILFLEGEKEACVVCAIFSFALAYSRLSAQCSLHLSPNSSETRHHLFLKIKIQLCHLSDLKNLY